MKKIVYLGYIREDFGDFLVICHQALQEKNISLDVVAFGKHEQSFKKYSCNMNFYDFEHLPSMDGPFANAELFIKLFPANLYILSSGYHNTYALFRNFFKQYSIPHLLTEYSSIDKVYHFDSGLHAEATIPPFNEIKRKLNISAIEEYVKPRYKNLLVNHQFYDNILNNNLKKILYVAVWDDAAGLKTPNPENVKRNLSPFFQSSYEAACKLIEEAPLNSMIILKSHPGDEVLEKKKLQSLMDNIRIFYIDSEIPIEELILLSDVIVTIGSTVSVLATFYKKPIIILGRTYLSNFELCYQLTSNNSLHRLISNSFQSSSEQLEILRQNFFDEYLFNYETYSIDKYLNSLGVKSEKNLIEKCLNLLSSEPIIETSFENTTKVLSNIVNHIKYKNEMIEERDKTIASQTHMIDERDKAIVSQTHMIDERDLYIKKLEQIINEIKSK